MYVKNLDDFYYNIIYDNDIITYIFAHKIGMSVSDFREKIFSFNAVKRYTNLASVIFYTEEDAQKALDWINSQFILNKLVED